MKLGDELYTRYIIRYTFDSTSFEQSNSRMDIFKSTIPLQILRSFVASRGVVIRDLYSHSFESDEK